MDDKVLTTKQAAEYLQTSLTTMFKLIREGKLKAKKCQVLEKLNRFLSQVNERLLINWLVNFKGVLYPTLV